MASIDRDHDDDAYNNTHRALLQAFLSRGSLTFSAAQPVLAAIQGAHEGRSVLAGDVTAADFEAAVAQINAGVSGFDLEVRSAQPQRGGRERVWALVNTTSDGAAQLATTHSADEIAFVRRLLDHMFEVANSARGGREVMAVNSMQAVKLRLANSARTSAGARASLGGGAGEGETQGSSAGNLTGAQAEGMLRRLVEEGWFEKAGAGYYTLSPRALMELRGWLLETYNEPPEDDEDEGVQRVKLCHACRDIVTIGQRCADRECLCRLHDHCAERLFRQGREAACPSCGTAWSGRDYVGVKAVRESEPARQAAPMRAPEPASDQRRSRVSMSDVSISRGDNGVHSDEEMDEEEE